ncbi:MAG: helix-turn-helix domain-containing protein [Firmicutes bacterium]|nr:helix-turn-helix domain-containing protein [Bacillota bacterium]
MKIFAERLKQLRTEKGISTKTLSEAIGVSDSTITRCEKNQQNIKKAATILKKLAKYFEVPTDYLLGLINEPYW